MKRIFALMLCLVLLSGCVTQEPYVPTGGGLYDPEATQPTLQRPGTEQQMKLIYYPQVGLNPYQTANYTNRVLFSLIYQSLFSVDRNYKPVPILCKNYTVSRDMRGYVFYLEEATFSDGSILTSEDVVVSLRIAMESPVYGGRLKMVQSVSDTGDGGVAIVLNTPYENLPLLLDIPIVKSTQAEDAFPLGTGPYRLADAGTGKGLLQVSSWWCQSPDLQVHTPYIPLVEAQSAIQIRDAFEREGVGLVCTDPGSDSYVDYRIDHEVWAVENGIFLYLGVNSRSKLFSIESVRKALTHAIDRGALVEKLYRGFAMAASLPASPDSPYYDSSLAAQYGYDAAAFQTAVTEALAADPALSNEMILLVNKADGLRVRTAEAIAQMLTAAGLKVTLRKVTGTAYTNALKWGNFDLHLGQTMLSATMDLSAFYSTGGALNYGGMADGTLLALCKEAMANSGNYYTLHSMAMEDAMLCPVLFRSYAVYAARGVLSRMTPSRDNVFFYTLGKTMEDARLEDY